METFLALRVVCGPNWATRDRPLGLIRSISGLLECLLIIKEVASTLFVNGAKMESGTFTEELSSKSFYSMSLFNLWLASSRSGYLVSF